MTPGTAADSPGGAQAVQAVRGDRYARPGNPEYNRIYCRVSVVIGIRVRIGAKLVKVPPYYYG